MKGINVQSLWLQFAYLHGHPDARLLSQGNYMFKMCSKAIALELSFAYFRTLSKACISWQSWKTCITLFKSSIYN